jgi:hypothetical protein
MLRNANTISQHLKCLNLYQIKLAALFNFFYKVRLEGEY